MEWQTEKSPLARCYRRWQRLKKTCNALRRARWLKKNINNLANTNNRKRNARATRFLLLPTMSTKTFSFAEVVQGRDASVRVTDDNLFYAVDLVMVVTGKNRDDAGKALRRLSDEVFPSDKMSDRTFPG